MALADRILQLKLISDVSDINTKMGQVDKGVGRMRAGFAKLKSFIGPAIAGIGLQLAAGLGNAFQEQLKHAQELRDAFVGLEAAGKAVGIPEGRIRGMADALRDVGVSLGVGEDAAIVGALRDILAISGKLGQSAKGVEAIFDVMRLFDEDFDTAKGIVINGIFLGRSRYLDMLGISGDTAGERLKNFNEKYGDAAEEFAKTSEGQWQIGVAEFDGHMLNLAILADQGMQQLKLLLLQGWNNLTGIVDGIARIFAVVGGLWGDDIGNAVATIGEKLAPVGKLLWQLVTSPLQAMQNVLGTIWKAVTGDVSGAMDDVTGYLRGAANTIIDLLNQLSNAFAFSANFEIPSFEIPDPTQLLEGGTITIGGGSVDFSRGPLFDTIPHLAQGGIVRKPTLALLGESGSEAVVPLGRGGMGVTVNVYATAVSPADVGREVVEAIEAYERRSGAGWRA